MFLLKFPTYNALLKLSQHVIHSELNTITLPAFELVASCCVCHLFCFCNFITYTRSSHDNSITIPDWQLLEYNIKLAFQELSFYIISSKWEIKIDTFNRSLPLRQAAAHIIMPYEGSIPGSISEWPEVGGKQLRHSPS